MFAIQSTSRKAIVGGSLLIWFAPFCWILFMSGNRWLWIKLWPILHGIVMALLLRAGLSHAGIAMPPWSIMVFTGIFSIAALALFLFLMFRFPKWRLLTALLALLISAFCSWGAYNIYRA